MKRKAITAKGSVPVGPYSPGVDTGDYVYVSGQTPLDPETGKLVEGDITAQTKRIFLNLEAILSAAGLSFDDVVKTTVFLADMGDFAAMNAEYATHFASPYPARSTIGVAALPLGARVEIELVAKR